MKETRIIMGMPITIWLPHCQSNEVLENAFNFFEYTDKVFSTYKTNSEINKINLGKKKVNQASLDVKEVLGMCETMKKATAGYFDIGTDYLPIFSAEPAGVGTNAVVEYSGPDKRFVLTEAKDGTRQYIDPSGLVKGWAVGKVSQQLDAAGVKDYSIDAGGDIAVRGKNPDGLDWKIGIRLPSNARLIAKELQLRDMALATSGNYERGKHIYNPHTKQKSDDLASVTVVGPDICTADVWATALFAMGKDFKKQLVKLPKGYDIYVIMQDQTAFFTEGIVGLSQRQLNAKD